MTKPIKIKKKVSLDNMEKAFGKNVSHIKKKIEDWDEQKKNAKTPKQIIAEAKKKAAEIEKNANTKATQIRTQAQEDLDAKKKELQSKQAKLKKLKGERDQEKRNKARSSLIQGMLKVVKPYKTTWRDKGSGATASVTFYSIKPAKGYLTIGHTGYPGYGKPKSSFKVMTLKANNGLIRYKYPVKYVRVWKDSGSGASWDGALWKAIPPRGYVAMGMLCTRGYRTPSTREMVCVEAKYTKTAKVSSQMWNDRRSGANSDASVWYNGQLGTFWAHASHKTPKGKVVRIFDLNAIKKALST